MCCVCPEYVLRKCCLCVRTACAYAYALRCVYAVCSVCLLCVPCLPARVLALCARYDLVGDLCDTQIYRVLGMRLVEEYFSWSISCVALYRPLQATSDAYPYCAPWALPWNYRRRTILRELVNYRTDVMCLQEVQADHFENFLEPELAKYNYAGVYKCKTREFMGQENDAASICSKS